MAVPLILSSVPAQTPYVQYVSGSGQTVFPYPFEITQDSDLVCLINGVAQPTDGGYTLSGQGTTGGGNLTFTVGQTVGTIITLYRNISIARITQLSQNGTFFSSNFNNEYNRIYLIMQQLQQSLLPGGNQAYALMIPNSNNPAPTTLLTKAAYANSYLSFDSNGNPQPTLLTSSGSLTSTIIATLLNPAASIVNSTVISIARSAAEIAASVTPVNASVALENVTRYGAVGDGVTDNKAFLTTANSVGQPLYFPAGTYYVASSLTLSVPVSFDADAVLKPANGATITINAPVNAGLTQIFNTSLGGVIAGAFRASSYPVEWWGATGNGKTSPSGVIAALSTAFTDANAAFTSADVGKSIYIVPPVNTTWAPFLGTIAAYGSATAVTLSGIPLWASNAAFTATCSGHTLSVSAVATGTLLPGQAVTGASGGTVIEYQLTGSQGSTGTYYVNNSQSIGSATAMTGASTVSYYYGTDDTAAITAANASVGQLATSAGPNVSYALAAATTKLSFLAPKIYLMSGQALIGANPSTVAGQINTACAMQWAGVGGSVTIAFGIASTTTDCVLLGGGGNTVNAAALDIRFDGCFSGQDGIVLGGFQNPFMRNVRFQNAARDALSIRPAAGSFIQQGDFQNIYLGPAGRHCIYTNPASGTFVNECDFVNLDLQYPSQRQANGTAMYFDTTSGGIDSWTVTNYKASTGWPGDPNYEPLGSWFYVAASNAIFPTAGITLTSGYCENGVTANPIGAAVAPIACATGSSAMIHVRGFYASYWGVGISHADHDAASVFTVAGSGGTQLLVSNQPYYAAIIDFVINVTDGTNSDYLHVQATGGKNATGKIDTIGTKMSQGTPPTYAITAQNSTDSFQVLFTNSGTPSLTVTYTAKTTDCGAAPIYYY